MEFDYSKLTLPGFEAYTRPSLFGGNVSPMASIDTQAEYNYALTHPFSSTNSNPSESLRYWLAAINNPQLLQWASQDPATLTANQRLVVANPEIAGINITRTGLPIDALSDPAPTDNPAYLQSLYQKFGVTPDAYSAQASAWTADNTAEAQAARDNNFFSRLDDSVRDSIPGGWLGAAALAAGGYGLLSGLSAAGTVGAAGAAEAGMGAVDYGLAAGGVPSLSAYGATGLAGTGAPMLSAYGTSGLAGSLAGTGGASLGTLAGTAGLAGTTAATTGGAPMWDWLSNAVDTGSNALSDAGNYMSDLFGGTTPEATYSAFTPEELAQFGNYGIGSGIDTIPGVGSMTQAQQLAFQGLVGTGVPTGTALEAVLGSGASPGLSLSNLSNLYKAGTTASNMLSGGGAAGSGGISSAQSLGALAGGLLGSMGGSKQAGTTTTTQEPWSPMQPYLLDAAKQAQANYNNNKTMSPATSGILSQAQGIAQNQLSNPALSSAQTAASGILSGQNSPFSKAGNIAGAPSVNAQSVNPNAWMSAGAPSVNAQSVDPARWLSASPGNINAQSVNPGAWMSAGAPVVSARSVDPYQFMSAGAPTVNAQAIESNKFMSAGSPAINAASGAASLVDAANAFRGLGRADPTAAYQALLSGNVTNPYLANVAKDNFTMANRNLMESIMPGIGAGASASGQYGGSRQGIAQGLAASRLNQDVTAANNAMFGSAYQQAQSAMANAAGQLAGYGMQGATANANNATNASLSNAQLANQAAIQNAANSINNNQFNANMGSGLATNNANRALSADTTNAANAINVGQFNSSLGMGAATNNATRYLSADATNAANALNNNQFNANLGMGAATNNANRYLTADTTNIANALNNNQFNSNLGMGAATNNANRYLSADTTNAANSLNNNQFNANLGMGAATNNANRYLTADTTNATNALNTQQFNANLGLSNNSQQLGQMNSAMDWTNTGNNMQNTAIKNAMDLSNYNNTYANNALNAYSSAINPMAGMGGSSSSPYYTNPYANALGGAVAGSQIFKNIF